MDEQKRASLLEDLANDAGRKRQAFLDDAGRQFTRFIDANRSRLNDLGGLVLIDEEPDYLSVTEEGTFRSRARFQDDAGEWVTESEEITDGAALVEIFNPADLYAAFVDAAEAEIEGDDEAAVDEAGANADEAGSDEDETTIESDVDDVETDDMATLDDWPSEAPVPRDRSDAARLAYDLALTFQERSQLDQAQLLDDFQDMAVNVAGMLGDSKIVEDEDERIWFRANGAFEGEVVPERDDDGEPSWQPLTTPDDMVQFYDPTDLFGDLAEALAEAYPEVAPELSDADDVASADDDSSSDD